MSWAGRWLLPAGPFGGALIIAWPVTWPIVAATALPTPYPFYRLSLPPFVALLLLGPPLFLQNLRWAGCRLAAHATETAINRGPEADLWHVANETVNGRIGFHSSATC